MGLIWYQDVFKIGAGEGMYRWGLRRGHSFSLGIHTMIFHVKIYAIKACIMETIEKGFAGRNIIYFLMVRQPSRPLKAFT